MSAPLQFATLILAAGLGTRMKSRRAKVLHEVAGRPMIESSIAVARSLGSQRVLVVLGHQREEVEAAIRARFGAGAVEVVAQLEQRGTGHAVGMAEAALANWSGPVAILSGDVPLLTAGTLRRLILAQANRRLALVTTRLASPEGYGRVVRDGDERLLRIVEHKDAGDEERAINEINAGLYCADRAFLFQALHEVGNHNAQGEYYLTDIVAAAARDGEVATVDAEAAEILGVNDRADLARADRDLRHRINAGHLLAGVTLLDPGSVRIDGDVVIAPDCVIGPSVELRGRTTVGAGVRIEAGCVLTDVSVGAEAHLLPYVVAAQTSIGPRAQVGPFAHLRPGTVLDEAVKIGNFVETKKAHFGVGAKASHLSYLGDAEIGAHANIGCGTITCNYDGYQKYKTVIGEGAFIGSDTQLVAPVTVGAHAVVAAGSTITSEVAPGALGISRVEQKQVPGYAERKRRVMEERGLGKKRG